MKIVVAPNALKGSLSATEAANALIAGIRQVTPDAELLAMPVADGGDGFTDILRVALKANRQQATVTGPTGSPVTADYLYNPGTRIAVIEIAAAAGLALLDPNELSAMSANTYGVGELIRATLKQGARHIIIGIGGSATTDGGAGMAQALGIIFRDKDDQPITPCGATLCKIKTIDVSGLDPLLREIQIQVACDVNNPLLGKQGAAHVFSPQKGASPHQVAALEAGLAHYADIVATQLNKDVRNTPGAGAAGGLGAGLIAFLSAELRPGAEIVLDLLGFDDTLDGADLVITAEGQLDGQTAFGKAPGVVARRAQTTGIPCIVIAGKLGEGVNELKRIGINTIYSLCQGQITPADAMINAEKYMTATATRMMKDFRAGSTATNDDHD